MCHGQRKTPPGRETHTCFLLFPDIGEYQRQQEGEEEGRGDSDRGTADDGGDDDDGVGEDEDEDDDDYGEDEEEG
jgi:hypothetical protein